MLGWAEVLDAKLGQRLSKIGTVVACILTVVIFATSVIAESLEGKLEPWYVLMVYRLYQSLTPVRNRLLDMVLVVIDNLLIATTDTAGKIVYGNDASFDPAYPASVFTKQ